MTKSLSGKYSQKHPDHAKQSATDEPIQNESFKKQQKQL